MREHDLSKAHWYESGYSDGSGGNCVKVAYDFSGAAWRKSCYSDQHGGDCVEVAYDFPGAAWRKSSYSDEHGEGDCVEVADNCPGVVPVRDSKLQQDSPVLIVPAASWAAFVEFSVAGPGR